MLVADAAVTALVPAAKVVLGTIKQGTVLPAISVKHISTMPMAAIDAQADFSLVSSRVQVTVETKDRVTLDAVLEVVRKCCNYQRGIIAGLTVVSVVRDLLGPAPDDNDAGIYDQTIDFRITYYEAN
nr:hypothetical protein [Duganella sp. CY15W]